MRINMLFILVLTIYANISFGGGTLHFPVGKGELIISNESQSYITIENHLLNEHDVIIGILDSMPSVFEPKQTYKISLTENLPQDARYLLLEPNKKGLRGFIFDAEQGEFYRVPGGVMHHPPQESEVLIDPPTASIKHGY